MTDKEEDIYHYLVDYLRKRWLITKITYYHDHMLESEMIKVMRIKDKDSERIFLLTKGYSKEVLEKSFDDLWIYDKVSIWNADIFCHLGLKSKTDID